MIVKEHKTPWARADFMREFALAMAIQEVKFREEKFRQALTRVENLIAEYEQRLRELS